jgi:FMN phosphatase YigB (HAD superfamily)
MVENSFKWICFDVGDTLIDNLNFGVEHLDKHVIHEILSRYGFNGTNEEAKSALKEAREFQRRELHGNYLRFSRGYVFPRISKILNLNVSQQDCVEMERMMYEKKFAVIRQIDGAFEILSFLKSKGFHLALISNAGEEFFFQELDAAGIDRKLFDVIIISGEVKGEKSTLIPFKVFLEKIKKFGKFKPEECLMIGDREDEDSYAKKLGMKTCLLKRYNRKKFDGIEYLPADFEISSLLELKKIVA